MTGMSPEERTRLREVARTAATVTSLAAVIGGERWRLDDWAPEVTEFIGEFDPPTVLALLDIVDALDTLLAATAAAIKRVDALHTGADLGDGSPEGVVLCNEDAHSWPCPTVRTLHPGPDGVET